MPSINEIAVLKQPLLSLLALAAIGVSAVGLRTIVAAVNLYLRENK